ncbi:AraC family transcriptional regulator [soil metagenome]
MPQAAREVFRSHPRAESVDIDHARELLSDVYLPVTFPSPSTSTNVGLRLNALKVGRVTAGYLRFGDAIRIRTAEATNYHLDIPLTGRAVMGSGTHGPVYGTPQTAALFMPGRPADLDCDSQFSQIAVMIPRADMHLELENLLGHRAAKPLAFSPTLDLASGPGSAVLQTLLLIDQASNDPYGLLQHPLAAHRLEQLLIESLLLAQPHNYSDDLRSPAPPAGMRPIAHAVELLRATPEHAWTVSELADDVAVSVRSLQEGFRRLMNNTPMAYLREVRLERVHEELTVAEPGTVTVTEVAVRWGFIHFGRFAARYRSKFSERPSETLRRAAG